VPESGLLTISAADGRDLLADAQADWSRPVPDCPGWTAADLTGHMGAILGWMAKIVTTGQAVPRRERETPPADRDALAAWYAAHLDRTIGILTAAPADSPAWTFSRRGDHRVSWWRRRLAVELAIHRWDAQHVAGPGRASPPPLDGDVATAGIQEFLTEYAAHVPEEVSSGPLRAWTGRAQSVIAAASSSRPSAASAASKPGTAPSGWFPVMSPPVWPLAAAVNTSR
jgi:uncharacterized protein (TIGR03083 family)